MDDADDDFRDIQVNAAAVSVLQRRQSGAAANARPGGTDDTESDRCFDRTSDSEGISDSSHGPRSTSSFNSASTKELAALNVTLSDDDDSVAKLSLNDNALNSFAVKQMAAASAATADAADVDAFSSGDPFDNLTDSESGAARSVAAADDDSRMIHSLAERGEFLLDDLVDGFVQAEARYNDYFKGVLGTGRVQALLAPTTKVVIPEQLQVDFIRLRSSTTTTTTTTGDDSLVDQYKAMLTACIEQHVDGINASANRRRSMGRRRPRREEFDHSPHNADVHNSVQAFLGAVTSSFAELVARLESNRTMKLVDERLQSLQDTVAEHIHHEAYSGDASSPNSVEHRLATLAQVVSGMEAQVVRSVKAEMATVMAGHDQMIRDLTSAMKEMTAATGEVAKGFSRAARGRVQACDDRSGRPSWFLFVLLQVLLLVALWLLFFDDRFMSTVQWRLHPSLS